LAQAVLAQAAGHEVASPSAKDIGYR